MLVSTPALGCQRNDRLPPPESVSIVIDDRQWAAAPRFAVELALKIGAAEGGGPEVFGTVRSIDMDPQGNVYVLDGYDRSIRVFDSAGTFVRTIGRQGRGPGELSYPVGISVDGDRLWVVDFGQNVRYTLFTTGGTYLKSFRRKIDGVGVPWWGTVDSAGNLYDWGHSSNARLGFQGSVVRFELFRVSSDGTFSSILTSVTEYQMVNGEVRMPFSPRRTMKVDPSGFIWMVNTDRYRLEQLDLSGNLVRSIEVAAPPRPVTNSEKDGIIRRYAGPTSWLKKPLTRSDIPDVKPLIRRLLADGVGHLLVELESREGAPRQFDVFDSFTGSLVGRLDISIPLIDDPLPRFHGDRVLGVVRDSLDVPYVVVLGIIGSPH